MNLILFFIYKHTQLISVSVNCIPVYGNLFIIKPYNYALLGRCNVNNTSLYVGPIMQSFEGIHFKETNIAKRSVHCRFLGLISNFDITITNKILMPEITFWYRPLISNSIIMQVSNNFSLSSQAIHFLMWYVSFVYHKL